MIHSIDFIRDGITVAVARAIDQGQGRYRLVGGLTLEGFEYTFQGRLTLPIQVPAVAGPGRPKGTTKDGRAMAALLCKAYCRARGLPYTQHAHALLRYSDRRSVDRAIKKTRPLDGITFLYTELDGSHDFVLHCPKGAALAVTRKEFSGHGFIWSPYQREAELKQFRFSSGGITPEQQAVLSALLPDPDQ